ncbi:SMI1/KNR4 family protein [Isobaculum melis]|uniref:SMI1 / KNR4 family (SUKH-1) n=1 Tax=Isobaculum melis TaxID=142588 RepID=A0A1H9T192_9LACT|nr:SMI1/KNR4 family protein [Isobaculum melis]SER90489.1 SMI1 / KNR4 family (SUKH-1) [Isobaculum melis]
MNSCTFESSLLKLKKLEKKIDFLEQKESLISENTLDFVENLLKINLNNDLRLFFKIMNGGFIGIDIFCLEKCVIETLECRRNYTDKRKKKLKNSIVISDDGTGNPILIKNTGTIYLFHHDDNTYEIIEQSLTSLIEDYISNLEKVAKKY